MRKKMQGGPQRLSLGKTNDSLSGATRGVVNGERASTAPSGILKTSMGMETSRADYLALQKSLTGAHPDGGHFIDTDAILMDERNLEPQPFVWKNEFLERMDKERNDEDFFHYSHELSPLEKKIQSESLEERLEARELAEKFPELISKLDSKPFQESKLPAEAHVVGRSLLPRLGPDDDFEGQKPYLGSDGRWYFSMFPSRVPTSRKEVHLLKKWMDKELEKLKWDSLKISQSSEAEIFIDPSSVKAVQEILEASYSELSRQVSVQCNDRGKLMEYIWLQNSHFTKHVLDVNQSLQEDIKAKNSKMDEQNTKIIELKNEISALNAQVIDARRGREFAEEMKRKNDQKMFRLVYDCKKYEIIIAELNEKIAELESQKVVNTGDVDEQVHSVQISLEALVAKKEADIEELERKHELLISKYATRQYRLETELGDLKIIIDEMSKSLRGEGGDIPQVAGKLAGGHTNLKTLNLVKYTMSLRKCCSVLNMNEMASSYPFPPNFGVTSTIKVAEANVQSQASKTPQEYEQSVENNLADSHEQKADTEDQTILCQYQPTKKPKRVNREISCHPIVRARESQTYTMMKDVTCQIGLARVDSSVQVTPSFTHKELDFGNYHETLYKIRKAHSFHDLSDFLKFNEKSGIAHLMTMTRSDSMMDLVPKLSVLLNGPNPLDEEQEIYYENKDDESSEDGLDIGAKVNVDEIQEKGQRRNKLTKLWRNILPGHNGTHRQAKASSHSSVSCGTDTFDLPFFAAKQKIKDQVNYRKYGLDTPLPNLVNIYSVSYVDFEGKSDAILASENTCYGAILSFVESEHLHISIVSNNKQNAKLLCQKIHRSVTSVSIGITGQTGLLGELLHVAQDMSLPNLLGQPSFSQDDRRGPTSLGFRGSAMSSFVSAVDNIIASLPKVPEKNTNQKSRPVSVQADRPSQYKLKPDGRPNTSPVMNEFKSLGSSMGELNLSAGWPRDRSRPSTVLDKRTIRILESPSAKVGFNLGSFAPVSRTPSPSDEHVEIPKKELVLIKPNFLRKKILTIYQERIYAVAKDPKLLTQGSFSQFVYDIFYHKYGLRAMAEQHLAIFVNSVKHFMGECLLIETFGRFCGFGDELPLKSLNFFISVLAHLYYGCSLVKSSNFREPNTVHISRVEKAITQLLAPFLSEEEIAAFTSEITEYSVPGPTGSKVNEDWFLLRMIDIWCQKGGNVIQGHVGEQ